MGQKTRQSLVDMQVIVATSSKSGLERDVPEGATG